MLTGILISLFALEILGFLVLIQVKVSRLKNSIYGLVLPISLIIGTAYTWLTSVNASWFWLMIRLALCVLMFILYCVFKPKAAQ